MRYASIAIDVPLRGAFTWSIPAMLSEDVTRGSRVRVPWRGRIRAGVVLAVSELPPQGVEAARIRQIVSVAASEVPVDDPQLALAEWLSAYYHAPVGECVKLILPGGVNDEKPARISLVGGAASWPAELDRIHKYLLEAGGSEDADTLIARTGARLLDLRLLETNGLIEFRDVSEVLGWRPRTIQRVSVVEGASAGSLGPKQREVLAFLAEYRESNSDELRELFAADRSTLRSLEKRGCVTLRDEEVHRDPFAGVSSRRRLADPVLTSEQADALARIDAMNARGGGTLLLRGVTGSGKTEVYVRAVRAALERNESALLLLPEIALTPQFVGVFRAALGDVIAVQHSGLSPAERRSQWTRIQRGELRVVIGARSAVFAPLGRPSLIIVDEEHDPSFKQDSGVRYNGRDVALKLAHLCGATTVLGSATPSIESVQNALRGRFERANMFERPGGRPLPAIELIDMRAHAAAEEDRVGRYFSPVLQAAVRDTWRAGEQSIIFLNRRGFAPVMQCPDCGTAMECASCDVAMTYHRRGSVLKCHYCASTTRVPTKCPTCGGADLSAEGIGTEQIETLMREAFEGIRTVRLDADAARGAGLRKVLDAFRNREADVLIGTQMVTKGHDFPGVTLVGVINADQSLRFPDFRSGERTWQILTQVAGRAGRGDIPGRVIVQTHDPDHPVLVSALAGDFDSFAEREIAYRARLQYPPSTFSALLRFEGKRYGAVWRCAEEAAAVARTAGAGRVRVNGPVDSPIARIAEKYRVQVFLRCPERGPLHAALAAVESHEEAAVVAEVHWILDVDPQNLL